MEKVEKLYTINVVEGFDPYEYLIPMKDEVTGEEILSEETGKPKMYLPAAAKKVWFRKAYPEGAIFVEQIPRDDGQYEFCARVYMTAEDKEPIGCGYALRTPASHEKYRPFESAQTLAEAKALESAGFGSEVTLCLQMQEAQLAVSAPEKAAAQDAEAKKAEAPTAMPSFETSTVEDTSSDEEVLAVFTALKEKEEKAKAEKKAKKKAKKATDPAPEQEAEETEEEPAEPEPAEEPAAAPDEAEEPAEPEEAEETADEPSQYVVTATDVKGLHVLDAFIGQSLSELGEENIKSILSLAGDKISPSFREACENFTETEAV